MNIYRKPSLNMMETASRFYSPVRSRGRAPIAEVLRALRQDVMMWLEWRASLAELRQLRDRELRDIGLTRYEIPQVIDYLLHRGDKQP